MITLGSILRRGCILFQYCHSNGLLQEVLIYDKKEIVSDVKRIQVLKDNEIRHTAHIDKAAVQITPWLPMQVAHITAAINGSALQDSRIGIILSHVLSVETFIVKDKQTGLKRLFVKAFDFLKEVKSCLKYANTISARLLTEKMINYIKDNGLYNVFIPYDVLIDIKTFVVGEPHDLLYERLNVGLLKHGEKSVRTYDNMLELQNEIGGFSVERMHSLKYWRDRIDIILREEELVDVQLKELSEYLKTNTTEVFLSKSEEAGIKGIVIFVKLNDSIRISTSDDEINLALVMHNNDNSIIEDIEISVFLENETLIITSVITLFVNGTAYAKAQLPTKTLCDLLTKDPIEEVIKYLFLLQVDIPLTNETILQSILVNDKVKEKLEKKFKLSLISEQYHLEDLND